MTAVMGMAFAACQPTLIDGPEPFATVDATVLANGITYQQFADEACTQPDEAGNFLKFNSASGVVQVFLEGSDAALYTGAGGVVKIPVKRGQEPTANLEFRIINGDGTFTSATKTFSVTPPTELSPEMLILVSDNGQKVWKYAAASPYGNAGYTESGANFNAPGAVDGKWWGADNGDALADQLDHAANEQIDHRQIGVAVGLHNGIGDVHHGVGQQGSAEQGHQHRAQFQIIACIAAQKSHDGTGEHHQANGAGGDNQGKYAQSGFFRGFGIAHFFDSHRCSDGRHDAEDPNLRP